MDATPSSSLELPQLFRQLTISEIHTATKNFDESLVIGRGGFGKVYKGTVSDGTTHLVAAIKRLDLTSNQGAEEFWNEVHMLSKLRHCHLVSLIGYCKDGQEMILVYEYMPHGTLDDHLHKFQNYIPLVRRLRICVGAARGLDYLHTGTGIKHGIIHRDVKSSNILLDDSWAAKISDFGLSKLGPINQPSTYVNTIVKGTFGYLDPDYFATGRLTRKSDVYAFGVVLLEVLSGKQAVDSSLGEEHWGLVNWAQESIKEGRLKQIVEDSIRERILPKCLKEFGRLADRCLHSNPKKRPTMAEVVICLESVLAVQEKANNTVPMFMSVKTGPSFADAVGRIAQVTKVIAEGGYENIFRLTFETVPDEKLLKSYACYLSTSAGPVMGILYMSSAKLAFCSDYPLSYKVGEVTEWSYNKVDIPLHQLKAVNASKSKAAEKYIQIISVDNHEFWFMGFVNYDNAVQNLQGALQSHYQV